VNSKPHTMNSIRKTFIVILASAGIRIDKINNSRIDALMLLVLGYGAHVLITNFVSFEGALIYYVTLFVIRYVYLFAGFVKNGFASRMIEKYGEEKAWNRYEMQTSFMFFQRGLSFGLLTHVTQWTLLDFITTNVITLATTDIFWLKYSCMSVGFALVLVGFWVNTASTFVIGIDTYYYKDLFLKRAIVDFKIEGPYKYFSNPMYGIGQCSAYGASLLVGSVAGLVSTLLNQVMMYTFYYLIEKPHINSIIEKMSIQNHKPTKMTRQMQELEVLV
jgi:hypothetical protein